MKIVGYVFGVAVLAFTVLMATKVWPYMSFERAMLFLGTKPDAILDNTVFMWGFYVHITSSVFVMAGGILQFFPELFHKNRWLHRKIGQMYVAFILLLAAPSGLILAIYANGGLVSKVGFSMQCLVWWWLTFIAWRAILAKNWLKHSEWMLKSYAVTLAAMSLRTLSYIMYYAWATKPMETYLTVTWLSWVGNLFIVELLIYFGLAKRLTKAFGV